MCSYTMFCPYCFASRRTRDWVIKWKPGIYDTVKNTTKCHECGQEMITLSYHVRLPKKNSKRGWKEFFEYFKNWGFVMNMVETQKVKQFKK